MTTAPRFARTAIRTLVAILAAFAPATADALDGAAAQLVDLRAENRLQVFVRADSASAQVVEDRVGRDLLAFHFRLEAVDAEGNLQPVPAATRLVLRIGSGIASQVSLSRDAVALTLPRPFAIRVGADDPIAVALVEDSGDEAVTLRLTIEYEPIERARTRLAVSSVRAEQGAATASATSFEWQQPVGGRMMAIAGLPLDRVATIALVDVATGERMWTTDLRGRSAGDARGAAAPRLGVAVEAGRTYRLEVTTTEQGVPAASVIAVVLPEAR